VRDVRLWWRDMNGDYRIVRRPEAVFYHGGVAGLAVGDFILPGGQVGADCADDSWYWGSDPEFCFITTDIIQAWHNALFCEAERGAGAVYRVAPVGRLRLDICETGYNFACKRARILARQNIPEWVRSAYKTDSWAFVEQWTAAMNIGGGDERRQA
jgi:hypothetical protein